MMLNMLLADWNDIEHNYYTMQNVYYVRDTVNVQV